MRIDKWLWCVRIYKSRSMATDECNKGRITMNENSVKPSHLVKAGDLVFVKKPPVNHSFRVVDIPVNRLPAKDVPLFAEETTSREELDKREWARKNTFLKRDRGTGRPTKKERRDIDRMFDDEI
jgi:ribosome-associated heat shock protein Hsp15